MLDGRILGVVFERPRRVAAPSGPLIDIGAEEWAGDLRLAVDPATRAVVAYGATGEPEPVNSDLAAFLAFLAAFRPVCDRLGEDVPPVVIRSAEESRLLLEARRRGELRPPAVRRPPVDRHREVRRLHRGMASVDPDALAPGRYWADVLEELRDGLI